MLHLPTFPTWHELHPLIIHFPIVLLLIAPLFVILGAFLPSDKGRPFHVSAFLLMLLGSAAILMALGTGEKAANMAPHLPAIRTVLEQHQNLAQTTWILFSVLTLAFGAFLFVPQYMHRDLEPKLHATLMAAFLIFYTTGAVFLIQTAHQGARLVHEFGVTVRAGPEQAAFRE